MKVNVEEVSTVQRRVTVELPAEEVDKTLGQLYRKLSGSVKLKGFRKGKAPRSVLERYYGSRVAAEAAESLIGQNYPQVLSQTGLEPVAGPQLEGEEPPMAVKGQDFAFQLLLDIRPEFEITPEIYKGLELKAPKLEVTDEQIDERIDALRERQAMVVPLEEQRPAGTGDVVVVSYSSFDGDTPVQGGEAENMEIELGAGQVHEEIELVLIKSKPGDILETTVEYPAEHQNPAVAGKSIRFKIIVKDLKEKVLPEADDDFAQSLGPEFTTLEALKERLSSDLEKAYEEQRQSALHSQVVEQLREAVEFELPPSLVASELEQMVRGVKSRLGQSGVDLEAAGLDEEKMLADLRPRAEAKVKAGIILSRISDLEKVEVAEADREAQFAKIAEATGQPAEVVRDIYIKNNMIPQLEAQILEEKTLQVILADAKISEVDPAELAEEAQKASQAGEEGSQAEVAGDGRAD